jgi:hypothetical protein
VKVMPMDYKRALREQAERAAEQPAPYGATGDGNQEALRLGEAGQHEDAAVAAERQGAIARKEGDSPGEKEQQEEEAEEEVLPSHG